MILDVARSKFVSLAGKHAQNHGALALCGFISQAVHREMLKAHWPKRAEASKKEFQKF